MPPDALSRYSMDELICLRFMEMFAKQSAEARAAIVGFLHLSTDSDRIEAVLTVHEEGRVALLLEASTAIQI